MFTWENKSLKRESIKGVLMMSKKKRERERKKESEQKRKNELRGGRGGKEQSEREKCNNKRMKNTVMKYKRRFFCTWCIEESFYQSSHLFLRSSPLILWLWLETSLWFIFKINVFSGPQRIALSDVPGLS